MVKVLPGMFDTRALAAPVLALAMFALLLAAACTGDDEPEATPTAAPATATPSPTSTPEPTPSPTPEPTPTATPEPTPTATPEPTPTPTPEPSPAPSMRNFRVTPSTTGGDLLDRLSAEENACIKEGVGDFVYDFLRTTPLLAAGGDPAAAASLFSCLSVDNVVLAGLAMSDAAGGGLYSDESYDCIADLSLGLPAMIFSRLGLPWEGEAADAGQIRQFIIGLYECWTDEERIAYLVGVLDQINAANPIPGSELIALLPESEVMCVQEQLPGDEYEAFLASNLERGFGDQLHECFSDDSHARIFIMLTDVRSIGGWSDETAACLLDLAREHPHFVEITTTRDPASLSPADFTEVARDGLLMLECMSEEEIGKLQNIGAQGLGG